ncbi:hypothetical protein [Stenotrophomonas sp. ZAC14A_NAIMI4_1]|uniref:hypothetical protein n=1 Tax=Stenotrophomonas sp. ZAC14A_NAIMI4_1 TaxID=2072412 RepID=UPI00131F1933|nr:hypothetical protein [Stenotrophomonas sp. ZAC14A_NAIMI4_1]
MPTKAFIDQKQIMIRDALSRSPAYEFCLRTLEGKEHRPFLIPESVEDWLNAAVRRGLAELEPFEKLTKKQREERAKKIVLHCEALRELLIPFYREEIGLDWPFQPFFDGAALESALNYQERMGVNFADEEDKEEDLVHKRFSIYHGIMADLGLVFDAIHQGALMLPELKTEIKKPNDPNVKRLRFIRRLTEDLHRYFGKPHRAIVLALTSVFFDATDLDEAAISKLAPVNAAVRRL